MHPDLYRVLQQDGFAVTRLDLQAINAADLLAQHLARNQLALALVYRGTYHWVLISHHTDPDQLLVVDSLKSEPYAEQIKPFLSQDALSITLINPADHDQEAGSAHREGIDEMLDVTRRK